MATNRNTILCSHCHEVYDCSRQDRECPHSPLPGAPAEESPPGRPPVGGAPVAPAVRPTSSRWAVEVYGAEPPVGC